MISTIDWLIDVLLKSIIGKLESWYLFAGVSVLAFLAALCIIWFVYRRFV